MPRIRFLLPSCSSYVLFHSSPRLWCPRESLWPPPSELESCPPSRGRMFLGENLRRKFCRLEGSSTGRLESCQISWDVSSQTIPVKRGQYTAYRVIPVSSYLTGLIEGTAIVVALCRGRNPHGPINSSARGSFGIP